MLNRIKSKKCIEEDELRKEINEICSEITSLEDSFKVSQGCGFGGGVEAERHLRHQNL